jgi:guanylate kinase
MSGKDIGNPESKVSAVLEHRGHRFILSAPSGAGKTTLCRAVLDRFPAIRYSISHTTRKPRPGEVDGIDYFFITPDEFQEKLRANRWAEWAAVHGNYYATSADFLESQSAAGRDVLLDIDVQGAKQILARYPDRTVAIFIMPPSMAVLKERLTARGAEDSAEMEKRLQNAVEEMAQKDLYHHVIVNDRLPEAIHALSTLINRYRTEKLPAEHSSNIGEEA